METRAQCLLIISTETPHCPAQNNVIQKALLQVLVKFKKKQQL